MPSSDLSGSRLKLLQYLADGRFHSGRELADSLGVTRSAVWQQVRHLTGYGLDVHAVSGKGYRLACPVDLLDPPAIEAGLRPSARNRVSALEVLVETDSTNQRLAELPAQEAHGRVCLAEYQHAGRGRRGSSWVMPLGAGLCLSVGWRFAALPKSFPALSLAVGTLAARVLGNLGVDDLLLKWPNDLFHRQRKLGGILVEVRAEAGGPCTVVVGLGLNVAVPERSALSIDQPWVDLRRILGPDLPSRSRLAAELISALLGGLEAFGTEGFAPFAADWAKHDAVRGRTVELRFPGSSIVGQARGVDEDGALLLSVNGYLQRYTAGELSLRALS